MLVEAAVFGGERRLDQVVGKLIERDRVIVPDAARADFVAVAIQEGDGELGLLEPVVVGGLPERRNGERQHHDQTAQPERQRLRQRFDEVPASPARDMEAVHEYGEALIKLARPGLGLVHPEVDARIEIEQDAAQPGQPAVRAIGEESAQGYLRTATQLRRSGSAQPLPMFYGDVLAHPRVPNYGGIAA